MDEREHKGVQAPINASRAALEAAHTRDADRAHAARLAASGTSHTAARSPRLRREQEQQRSSFRIKPLAVLLGCGLALLCIVVLGGALRSAFLYEETPAEVAERELAETPSAADAEFCSTKLADTCRLQDSTYRLERAGAGRYRFVCMTGAGAGVDADGKAESSSTSETVLAEGKGKPVGFALVRGTFYLLVQRGDSWHVVSMVVGDGSLPVALAKGRGRAKGLKVEDGEVFVRLKGGSLTKVETD